MNELPDVLLNYAQISALTGLAESTLRSYHARGQMPKPDDDTVPDRPRWLRSTITRWRRGQMNKQT